MKYTPNLAHFYLISKKCRFCCLKRHISKIAHFFKEHFAQWNMLQILHIFIWNRKSVDFAVKKYQYRKSLIFSESTSLNEICSKSCILSFETKKSVDFVVLKDAYQKSLIFSESTSLNEMCFKSCKFPFKIRKGVGFFSV